MNESGYSDENKKVKHDFQYMISRYMFEELNQSIKLCFLVLFIKIQVSQTL